MKAKFINQGIIEGYIYDSDLKLNTTGQTSKHPGTAYISGTLSIATDNACTNIVPVHFTYVTANTSSGKNNVTFSVLNDIVSGKLGTIMANGAEHAGKVHIDSAIALNEFYSDRNGKTELVSNKRFEGGFVSNIKTLNPNEEERNNFKVDMLITNVSRIEADPEKGTKEKAIIRGCIFDFRKSILPVDFSMNDATGIAFFEGLDASPKSPVPLTLWGRQISQTVNSSKVSESKWGEAYVQNSVSTRRDWVITGSESEPMEWDSEDTITAKELTEAMANREIYLAGIKQRQDEYKASKTAAVPAATGGFNF